MWVFPTWKLSFVALSEIIWAQDFLPLSNTFLETFDLAWPESQFHSSGGHLGLKYKAKSS